MKKAKEYGKPQDLKVSLFRRLHFAWCAFFLIPVKGSRVQVYRHYCDLRTDYRHKCDTQSCTNLANVCMTPWELRIEIKEDDYYHVCNQCAEKVDGKTQRIN